MSEEAFNQQEEIRRVSEAKRYAKDAQTLETTTVITESEASAAEAYKMFKSVIEFKRQQIIKEQELQTDISQLIQQNMATQQSLAKVAEDLAALVKLRSVNAEKESKVLDHLLEL